MPSRVPNKPLGTDNYQGRQYSIIESKYCTYCEGHSDSVHPSIVARDKLEFTALLIQLQAVRFSENSGQIYIYLHLLGTLCRERHYEASHGRLRWIVRSGRRQSRDQCSGQAGWCQKDSEQKGHYKIEINKTSQTDRPHKTVLTIDSFPLFYEFLHNQCMYANIKYLQKTTSHIFLIMYYTSSKSYHKPYSQRSRNHSATEFTQGRIGFEYLLVHRNGLYKSSIHSLVWINKT